MSEELELRTISAGAIPSAIDKAKHYRLLNQPAEAESILRDILDVEPENQEAMVVLVLALTDRFEEGVTSGGSREAETMAEALTDRYHRAYYAGSSESARRELYCKRAWPRLLPTTDFGRPLTGMRRRMPCGRRGMMMRPCGGIPACGRFGPTGCDRSSMSSSSRSNSP